MSRTLYGWEDDGKFYLSAFVKPRAHDGKRPAIEFGTRALLDGEISNRRADLVWEESNGK
jgi:hypothetical protein